MNIPFYFPNWFLNKKFVKLFNYIYYLIGKNGSKEKLVNWDDYFYPLDSILEWNKIYGKKGFVQYQCVIPLKKCKEGLIDLLREIEHSKASSFLSVLKRFGKQNGKFSFPMEGYTLALDFPVNKKELVKNFELDKKKYWKINDSSNNDQLKAVTGICLVFSFLLTMGLLANLTSI